MIEQAISAVVLALCLGMIVRLMVGPQRRYRFDQWARRTGLGIKQGLQRLVHWRSSRKTAERVAEDAIRRARGEGSWDGNVYKPKSFKRPPRDKLH